MSDPSPMHATEVQPAVYFYSLTVENVRCFGAEVQTLILSDDSGQPAMFTILLGDNSTGKTTLLQCLAGTERIGSHLLVEANGQREQDRSTRLWVYQFFEERFPPMTRNGTEAKIKVEFNEPANSSASRGFAGPGFVSITIDGAAHIVQSILPRRQAPKCFGYGAGRGATSGGDGSEFEDCAASLFLDGVKLLDAEEWLAQLDYSASKPSSIQEKQKQRLHQVREILIGLLPDVEDIRFSQPSEAEPKPRAEFKTPYGWVPLRSLGHGYRSMISWMVDFASRMVRHYPESQNPLAEPAVVLVDEIDLHLHPKWQRQIIPHLMNRFPKTQFIVTAHSPLIVQSALDPNVRANVAVLRREGDHAVIDNDVESVRAWTVDQILTGPIYGLPTARPASLDDKIQRRKEILSKSALDENDRQELKTLELEIGALPSGESADDAQRLLKLTEETQELLKKNKGTGS